MAVYKTTGLVEWTTGLTLKLNFSTIASYQVTILGLGCINA